MGHLNSGVYRVYPDGMYSGLDVYCDMETDGGGWLVRTIDWMSMLCVVCWSS